MKISNQILLIILLNICAKDWNIFYLQIKIKNNNICRVASVFITYIGTRGIN